MYGLIIKKKWLELILNGKKNLEIRGSDTKHINEPIALIESGSGLVIGTAVISGTFPLYGSNKAWFENCWEQLKNYNDTKNKNCHMVQISYDELLKRYKKGPKMGHFLSCNRNKINAWRTVEHDVHPLNRTSFFPSYENHV